MGAFLFFGTFLNVIFFKSLFISTYSYLFGVVVFQTAIHDFIPNIDSWLLVLTICFALLVLYIANIIFSRLFTMVLIPKQVEMVDNWLNDKLKDKKILSKILYTFIFYSPLIFIFSSFLRFFIWSDPFMESLILGQPMYMMRGGRVIAGGTKETESVKPLFSKILNISVNRYYSSYLHYALQHKKNYLTFHENLILLGLNSKFSNQLVTSFDKSDSAALTEIKNDVKVYKDFVHNIKKNELNYIKHFDLRNSVQKDLNSLLDFSNRILDKKIPSADLELYQYFVSEFPKKFIEINNYVEVNLKKLLRLVENADLQRYSRENAEHYRDLARTILLKHEIVINAHTETMSLRSNLTQKNSCGFTLFDMFLYELILINNLDFNKLFATDINRISFLTLVLNTQVVPIRGIIEPYFTAQFIDMAKIGETEQKLLMYRVDKGVDKVTAIRNKHLSDANLLTQISKESEKEISRRSYDVKFIEASNDPTGRMKDEVIKGKAKFKKLYGGEEGETVFIRSKDGSFKFESIPYGSSAHLESYTSLKK